ncbi:hypothetical protein H7F50_13075 [Novosphingobium flavum]|uniref:Uncharacterized protein n=1 Tax=Novosphingobium aerophilum TaxID=2839843 RepID=A0A7X1F894_9SPHN|nr:hypothetical protein [Novosphingobium aerophilum]MBC2652201.1 hypothetical protein [Novosphingobium aerophilum]MBC2662686.1 hypothetical protein [Novosphingobium aerophilum]
MSIHFAASRRLPTSAVARHLSAPRSMQAVNDNYGQGARAVIDNPLLRATLEHFATHGLAAAALARTQAEDAFLSEDADSFRHWMAVCRLLDRRMAGRLGPRSND